MRCVSLGIATCGRYDGTRREASGWSCTPAARGRQHAVSGAHYESDFGLLLTGGEICLAGTRPNIGTCRDACIGRAHIRGRIVAWHAWHVAEVGRQI